MARGHNDGDKQRREAEFAELLMGWIQSAAGNACRFKPRFQAQSAEEWGACGFEAETPDGRKFHVIVWEVNK